MRQIVNGLVVEASNVDASYFLRRRTSSVSPKSRQVHDTDLFSQFSPPEPAIDFVDLSKFIDLTVSKEDKTGGQKPVVQSIIKTVKKQVTHTVKFVVPETIVICERSHVKSAKRPREM